jgi:hypothetical protein
MDGQLVEWMLVMDDSTRFRIIATEQEEFHQDTRSTAWLRLKGLRDSQEKQSEDRYYWKGDPWCYGPCEHYRGLPSTGRP